jgi:chemotaxis response regulator CheB
VKDIGPHATRLAELMKRRARKIGGPTRGVRPSARKIRAAARVASARRGREAFIVIVGIGASIGGLEALRRLF